MRRAAEVARRDGDLAARDPAPQSAGSAADHAGPEPQGPAMRQEALF
jgi:hypothetical protein